MRRSGPGFFDASSRVASDPARWRRFAVAAYVGMVALDAGLFAAESPARAQANAAPLPPGRPASTPMVTTQKAPSAGGAVLTVRPDAREGFPQPPDGRSTKASVDPAASSGPAAGTGAQAVQGVTADSITFGMVSAFSGASKDAGHAMKVGVETAFAQANNAGGVNGRKLKLDTVDDGYEPARTLEGMRKAWDGDKVFGFVGQYGTPTAMVAAPYALEHHALFFGAFTGSTVLRRDPPDRYVFNYRPGYAEETEQVVKYLVQVRHIAPEQMMVFAQDDGFGDAGYAGVQKAMRTLRGERAPEIARVNYTRNTLEVGDALKFVAAHRRTLKAVVMVATARAAAKFIERTKDVAPGLVYTDCSGVGSTTLAEELSLLGPKYAAGVIVTQIVPAVEGYSSAILDYKKALETYAPGEKPDYVSFEGYVVGNLLVTGLKQAGANLTTETLVEALERLRDVDMGLGTVLTFNRTRHQASDKVWGTVLDGQGHYAPLELN